MRVRSRRVSAIARTAIVCVLLTALVDLSDPTPASADCGATPSSTSFTVVQNSTVQVDLFVPFQFTESADVIFPSAGSPQQNDTYSVGVSGGGGQNHYRALYSRFGLTVTALLVVSQCG